MDGFCDFFDWRDCSEDVRSVGTCYEFCLWRHEAFEDGWRELRVGLGFCSPPDEFAVFVFGELDPGCDVGFVVEEGNDDF